MNGRSRVLFVCCVLVFLVAGCSGGGERQVTSTTAAVPYTSRVTSAVALSTTTTVTVPATAALYSPCRVGDLAFVYYGGGAGAGSEFGTIRIRNVSARPCGLSGSVIVSGISATGTVDTQIVSYPVAGTIRLTARTPTLADMQPPPAQEVVADLEMSTEYRDDPTSRDGLCHANHVVVPASWRVTLAGGTQTVPNYSYDSDPQWPHLLTCNGEVSTPSAIESAATGF